MNNIFNNEHTCPICNAKFFEDEEIVYCPVCGAPHHKNCWNSNGQCAFADKHGTAEQWSETGNHNHSDTEQSQTHDAGSERVCPSCRKIIDKNHLFCPWCGYDFIANEKSGASRNSASSPFGNPFGYNGSQNGQTENEGFPFGGGVFSAMPNYDPLGGVDPNEDIDGVKAEKVGAFVGSNSRRYIPIFAQKNQKGKSSVAGWNWAAFLVPQYWSMYRKCYFESIFAFIITLISEICLIPFTNELMQLMNAGEPATYGSQMSTFYFVSDHINEFSRTSLYLVAAAVVLVVLIRIFYAMFGDRMYKKHCISKIKNSSEQISELGEQTFCRKYGNVNILLVLISYLGYQLVTTVIQMLV